jgi:hypothetical protein
MIKFENSNFVGTRVRIDSARYKGCTFTDCVIEYAGEGPMILDSCTFNSCTWTLVGPARRTLDFLTVMQSSFGDFGEALVQAVFDEIKNPHRSSEPVSLPDADV